MTLKLQQTNSKTSMTVININVRFSFVSCYLKLAASRPLPRPPIEAAAVERKRRIKKTMESKRVDVTAASTSVGSSKDGLLPLPQVRATL